MSCFVSNLQNEISNENKTRGHFFWEVVIGLMIPFVASIVVSIILIVLPDELDISRELVFVNSLKLCSLGVLAWHTHASLAEIPRSSHIRPDEDYRPFLVYKLMWIYMTIMTIILTAHTVLLLIPQNASLDGWLFFKPIYSFIHNWKIVIGITILSFLYIPGFIIGNLYFIKHLKGNVGAERFASAFNYGVNFPFLLAFFLILIIALLSTHEHTPAKDPEMFLSGAVAFLIFSSTAASICVDRYARPFLASGKGCPDIATQPGESG